RGQDLAPRPGDSSHRGQSQEGTNPRRPGPARVNRRPLSLELRGRGELVSSNLMPIQADSDALPVAVLTYDLDGTVTSANRAAAALLESDSLIGTKAAEAGWLITDAAGWPDPGNFHPALEAARTGQPQRGVVAHITTPQGVERWPQA